MSKNRVKLPFSVTLGMITSYAAGRLREQLQAVALIVLYLLAFQILVFGRAPEQALRIAGGIGLVVLGLALFLEGLLLGLMPLAQQVGIQLSSRSGLKTIIPIGFLLGVTATIAEPAIAALRTAGSNITAWESPLLFFLLQQKPEWLIIAIAIGVGIAVAIGMARFQLGFPIKPLILIILAVLLPVSFLASKSFNLSTILGLAWDGGAVTTGAVTVPLVLAIGIGISKASSSSDGAASGFGTVALASAFPVFTVILLGYLLLPQMPQPSSEKEFFSVENREQALLLFESGIELKKYAIRYGSEESRVLFLNGQNRDLEQQIIVQKAEPSFLFLLKEESLNAARVVLPLTAFLALVLFILMREKPRYLDEISLGIVFTLVGMCLLTTGIRAGLSQLGNEVGGRLPEVYKDVQVEKGQITINNFDREAIFPALSPDEGRIEVFNLFDGKKMQVVRFRPEWYEPEHQRYVHHIRSSSLTHPELSRIGVFLILLFAFGMGYGSTVAEPALKAVGLAVEDFTVGTIKSSSIITAVSIGVGIGLLVGVIRILYNIPMIWMLLPPYLLLFPLTMANNEDFAGIAWDCGGITTGPITVPLVLAMGLGFGRQLAVSDGFGILAMASVYPILSVLLFGLIIKLRQKRFVRAAEGVNK